MQAFAVIATVVIIGVLIFACVKRWNVLACLVLLSFVGYACATLVTGSSVMGEKTDGFVWFDVFEMFNSSITGTFTMMGFLVLVVMAYSDFMGKIKASDMFAGILAIPLKKIPSKAVVLVIGSELALLIHWVVPSGMGCFMVCMATLFPALIAAGCNPVTSAVALLLGANTASGPASSLTLMSLKAVGSEATAADAFIQFGIVLPLIVVFLAAIINVVWSAWCEKHGGPTGECETPELDLKSLGVPYWYALMPLLPLVLILIFSKICVGNIVIGIVAAYILCWCLFFLVHVLRQKKGEKKEAFNLHGDGLWTDMGIRFGQVVSIVVMGTMFGQAMGALGGIKIAINFLINNLGFGYAVVLFICFVLFLVMGALGGTSMAIAVIMPIVGTAAAAAGVTGDALTALAVVFTFGAGSYCLFAQPYDPKILYMNRMYKVDVMYVLKRTIVPGAVGASLLTFVLGGFMYGIFI